MTATTPSSLVPFAAQSRDEPEPYSLPARTSSGTSSSRYLAEASAVGVEVALLDPVLVEVERGGRALLDRARGRDVVGRDAVAELGQHARARDVLRRLGGLRDVLEERGAAHIG